MIKQKRRKILDVVSSLLFIVSNSLILTFVSDTETMGQYFGDVIDRVMDGKECLGNWGRSLKCHKSLKTVKKTKQLFDISSLSLILTVIQCVSGI